MKFVSYFFFSLLSLFGVIAYAIHTREQFYPVILFLTNSKVSFLIWGNMIVAMAILVGKVSKSLFLGNLREAEIEILMERAKYSIFETCLALTIFRNELSAPVLLFFGLLLFVKSFHWLAKSRFEYLEQVMPLSFWTYIRFSSLLVVLSAVDFYITYSTAKHTINHGKSVTMLFGFEFGLLVVSVFNLSSRYGLFLLDNRFVNGLSSKGLYVMIVDLICEAFKCIIYVVFFCLLFSNYGLPIHIVREVWVAFHNFQRKLSSFLKYLRLSNNIDQRFENATPDEIASAGDCLICREAMETGKKLPCGHIFHLDCLRMWLQHQQSCPLCRADIPTESTTNPHHSHPHAHPPPLAGQNDLVPPNVDPERDLNNNHNRDLNQPQGMIDEAELQAMGELDENFRRLQQQDRLNHVHVPGRDDSSNNNSNSNLIRSHDGVVSSRQGLLRSDEIVHNVYSDSFNQFKSVNPNVALEVPNLFIIRCETDVDVVVRKETNTASTIIRRIRKNSVVFIKDIKVTEMIAKSDIWYGVSGGWIREINENGTPMKLERFNGDILSSNQVSSDETSSYSRLLGSQVNVIPFSSSSSSSSYRMTNMKDHRQRNSNSNNNSGDSNDDDELDDEREREQEQEMSSRRLHGQTSITSSPYSRPSKRPSTKAPNRQTPSSFPPFSGDIPGDSYDSDIPIDSFSSKNSLKILYKMTRDMKKNVEDLNSRIDSQMKLLQSLLTNSSAVSETTTTVVPDSIPSKSLLNDNEDISVSNILFRVEEESSVNPLIKNLAHTERRKQYLEKDEATIANLSESESNEIKKINR